MPKLNKFYFDSKKKREEVRINKYLSDSGLCSRREADVYIEKGDVLIDGVKAELGSFVLPEQKVSFCGKIVTREIKLNLIAFNKPQGIVCTTDRREPDNIIDFIKYESRIYPIGRLDKDSEGLILLTNDGDIANKILRAGNNHEKEYIVKVNKVITHEFLKGMSVGVPILDTVTRPCFIEAVDNTTFRIILTQGLNRQIRRMCEHFGYKVVELKRIRIMNINLGRLKTGGYRNLTEKEMEGLSVLIEEASNAPDFNDSLEYDKKKNAQVLYKKNNVGRRSQKNRNMMEKDAAPLKIRKAALKKKGKDRKNSDKVIDFKSGSKDMKSFDKAYDYKSSNKGRKSFDKAADYKSGSKDRKSFNKAVDVKSGNKGWKNFDKDTDYKRSGKDKKSFDKGTDIKSGNKSKKNVDKGIDFKTGGKSRENQKRYGSEKSLAQHNKAIRGKSNGRKTTSYKRSGRNSK